MLDWFSHLADAHAYLALLLALLLVNLVPPIPAESTVPFVAALFDSSLSNIPLAIAAGTLGLVLVLAGHRLSHALPGITSLRVLLLFLIVFFCFYIYRLSRYFRA